MQNSFENPKPNVEGEHRPRPFTLVLLKPMGVEFAEAIYAKLATRGEMVAGGMVTPTARQLANHYALMADQPQFFPLIKYMAGKQTEVSIWEGGEGIRPNEFIQAVRSMVGKFNPAANRRGQIRHLPLDLGLPYLRVVPHTIDGFNQFCYDNLIHTSDSLDNALREINVWFADDIELQVRYLQNYQLLLQEES